MGRIVRRRYLGGVVGGLLAAACGKPTVKYVGKAQAGPAGPAGPQGAKGATGAQGAPGPEGALGKAAPKPIELTYLNKHMPGTVGDAWDKKMIKGFQAEMSHVTLVSIPTKESRKTKFTVMAAAGTPASMVQNDWGVWVDLARGGFIMEMTNLFKTAKITPVDTFLRWSVEQYRDSSWR